MGMANFYHTFVPEKNTSGKIEWIKEKIKEGWIKYATKVIFIDHIDFLTPSSVKTSDNEQIALKRIAIELKQLALELEVTIVVMAHIKKIDDNREPRLHDIGYSAGIFQLADYVFMIYREKITNSGLVSTEGDMATNNTFIRILKNRETGDLKYIKATYSQGRFIQLTKGYEEQPKFN